MKLRIWLAPILESGSRSGKTHLGSSVERQESRARRDFRARFRLLTFSGDSDSITQLVTTEQGPNRV